MLVVALVVSAYFRHYDIDEGCTVFVLKRRAPSLKL